MVKLDRKIVCTQVDSGASISHVWEGLVPTIPEDAHKMTAVGITGSPVTLPVVPITKDKVIFDAVVYQNASVHSCQPSRFWRDSPDNLPLVPLLSRQNFTEFALDS